MKTFLKSHFVFLLYVIHLVHLGACCRGMSLSSQLRLEVRGQVAHWQGCLLMSFQKWIDFFNGFPTISYQQGPYNTVQVQRAWFEMA